VLAAPSAIEAVRCEVIVGDTTPDAVRIVNSSASVQP
jgi:hypothetical protein